MAESLLSSNGATVTVAPPTSAVVKTWLSVLDRQQGTGDDPNYFASNPRTLVTSSDPVTLMVGTGSEILSSVLHSCESTNHELIIVTCFWAHSSSQESIKSLLLNLSHNAKTRRPGLPLRKIRVRICLSSLSISQKLFHTTSLNGYVYPPESWQGLGLPSPEQLGGLDLIVKSIFIRPFSVMHPKFILMDRERAWFPSCNVSWEEWFEGCIELRGGITSKLFDFWTAFWGREGGGMKLPSSLSNDPSDTGHGGFGDITLGGPAVPTRTKSGLLDYINLPPSATQTLLLPSPHHRKPNFQSSSSIQAPPTPLNVFILTLLATATRSVWMQTPNLTCGPILNALLTALRRGIDVTIITSRMLMIVEQIVTAGTITEYEIWKLRRRYLRMIDSHGSDPEAGVSKPGHLRIGYFKPMTGLGEPVKSHLKLTVVDDEITVLGSGNMDRASWFTSQELGVALLSKEVAEHVKDCVTSRLEGRVEWVCQ